MHYRRNVPANWPLLRERFALVLLAGLFAASVYRAASLSIAMDEAYTYLSFVAPPLRQILTTYTPNHHVLYSLLAKACVEVFGVSELSLRLPALLGCLLCFVALWQLCHAMFGARFMMLLSLGLVTLNPMVFDFMSQARGYGLALGFYLFGVVLTVRFLLAPAARHANTRLMAAGAMLGLSLATNVAFAIPVAALHLLFFARVREPRWKAALCALVPEIIVFGAIAASPLSRADRHSFVGFSSALETVNNFAIACVLHDWEGNGLWTRQVNAWVLTVLYPAFRVVLAAVTGSVLLLAARRIWRSAARPPTAAAECENDLWLFVFGGTLVLTALLTVATHFIGAVPYPYARVVLYCWPVLVFTICLLVDRFRKGGVAARSFSAVLLVFCAAMTIQSALQFDLNHFGWLKYSAGTRQIADFIRQREPRSGKTVTISTSEPLFACLNFYRAMYSLPQWRLSVPADGVRAADYMVMDVFDVPKGAPQGYRVIWSDWLSGAAIAAPQSPLR